MAYQASDIDTLKAAIATGAQRVRFADHREVYYRTLDDMFAVLQFIEEEVNGKSGRLHSVAGF